MRLHSLLTSLATALMLAVPGLASAQVLLLPASIDGEIDEEQSDVLRTELEQAARAALADQGVLLVTESEAADLGADASCEGGACVVELGEAAPLQLVVRASIYGAAEIYDVTITAYDANTGDEVDSNVDDCTFCLFDEAVQTWGDAVETLLARTELPDATGQQAVATTVTVEPDTSVVEPAVSTSAYQTGAAVLRIQAQPSSAEIRVNGAIVGRGTAEIGVGAQSLSISLSAPDHDEFTREIVITDADVSSEAQVNAYFAMARTTRRVSSADVDRDTFNQRAVGGILMGSGAAVLIGGIVALTLDGNSSCSDGSITVCPSLYETTGLGTALTVVGAAATGVGAAFFATANGPERSAATTPPPAPAQGTRFALVPTRSGGRVILSGRF